MQGAVAQINYMQRIHKNVLLGFDFTHLVIIDLFSLLTKNSFLAMVANCLLVITLYMLIRFKVEQYIILDILFQFKKELLLLRIIKYKLKIIHQLY